MSVHAYIYTCVYTYVYVYTYVHIYMYTLRMYVLAFYYTR